MARMPRLVVPNYPHHVTQRGARRQRTFFSEKDYEKYIDLLSDATEDTEIEIWAYCLMPNHVHFVAVPRAGDSLARLFSTAHRQYTRHINFREGWRGHLWQERFHSFVMDERHLIAAVRYVEMNPVRASLCRRPEDWAWSSARAHLTGHDDALVSVAPMLARIGSWSDYLTGDSNQESVDAIRLHTRTGRPAGEEAFLVKLEAITGRSLRKKKPGPKAGEAAPGTDK